MKIAYIVNARIPTEKAHGYQISKMCSEWAKAGAEVSLYVPHRVNPAGHDPFLYYGLEKNFSFVEVACFDVVRFARLLGPVAFKVQTWLFLRAMRRIDIGEDAFVYSRNPEVIADYSKRGKKTIYDAHSFPRKSEGLLKLVSDVSAIVANSNGTAAEFRSRGFERVLIAPNGVDIKEFDIAGTVAGFRSELGLPPSACIAAYVGHLYSWKGVDTILDAAAIDTKIIFVIAGGTEKDIARHSALIKTRGLSNIVLLGHVSRERVPKVLRAADVLLLPNAPVSVESERYTSPLKMFEYMASGVSIVASDLPSIREVLSENEAWFFTAGDPKSLANALRNVFSDERGRTAKSRSARRIVERYSWKARAEAIIKFICAE